MEEGLEDEEKEEEKKEEEDEEEEKKENELEEEEEESAVQLPVYRKHTVQLFFSAVFCLMTIKASK